MVLQKNETDIKIRKYTFSNSLLKTYNKYSNSLDKLDITKDTKEWRLKHIRGLLHTMEINKISMQDLSPVYVYDYLSGLSHYSDRTREHRAVCIRFFLNWCNQNNFINFSGEQILNNIKCNKNEKLITYYTNEEITKIINSVDTNIKDGKRDFAIILLFSYYGLRGRDVRNLKFENIKWNDNKIVVVHQKNNVINSFNMFNQIRYALIDYLKNERIKSNSEYIFIDNNGNKLSDHIIYNIVTKYFNIANIDTQNKKHGSHALRHSLATSLLNDDKSIFEISNVLGHKNIVDTTTYLRVDLKKLKKFSLEVPEWKN